MWVFFDLVVMHLHIKKELFKESQKLAGLFYGENLRKYPNADNFLRRGLQPIFLPVCQFYLNMFSENLFHIIQLHTGLPSEIIKDLLSYFCVTILKLKVFSCHVRYDQVLSVQMLIDTRKPFILTSREPTVNGKHYTNLQLHCV